MGRSLNRARWTGLSRGRPGRARNGGRGGPSGSLRCNTFFRDRIGGQSEKWTFFTEERILTERQAGEKYTI